MFILLRGVMLLRKENSLSTKDFDSGGYREFQPFNLLSLNAPIQSTLSPSIRNPSLTDPPIQRRVSPRALPPRYTNQLLANILVLLSVPLMVSAYAFSNYHKVQPCKTVFAKFLVQTVLQIVLTLWKEERIIALRARNHNGLIIRGAIAACHTFVLVLAQLYLPLTTVFTLTSTGIIFTFLCTYQYTRNKFTRNHKILLLLAALGIAVTIIAQTAWPLLNPSYHFHSTFPYHQLSAIKQLIGCLLLVVWMGVWGCSLLYGQNPKSDPNQTILIHSVVGLFIFSIGYLVAGISGDLSSFVVVTLTSALMLAASNYLFTWGFHIATKRTVTTLLSHANIPISYAISLLAFGENPSWVAVIGSILMLASVYTLLLNQ